MSKKDFKIENFKQKKDIVSILDDISRKPLRETSHLFNDYGAIPIGEAAKKSTEKYFNKAKTKPAIALLSVVLAANRNYNKVVKPNLDRIEKTDLATFGELRTLLVEKSKTEFYEFWGHKDEKKYNTLNNLLLVIDELETLNLY